MTGQEEKRFKGDDLRGPREGLSLWDSLMVASAPTLGCEILLTDPLQHGQELGDLRVVSPFKERP
jgi:predicted nucleic acid-binding protein